MSDKPTVSEIKALRIRATVNDEARTKLIYEGIPSLLDLVSRMGKELGNQQCPACEKYFSDPGKPCAGCKEARALLEEIKL